MAGINYKHTVLLTACGVGVLAAAASGGISYVKYSALERDNASLRERNQILEDIVSANLVSLSSSTLTNQELSKLKDELQQTLLAEQAKNAQFQSQVNSISGALGTLTKLSQTDKELLAKYSKVYFLNENYVPPELSRIDSIFALDRDKELQIHTKILPFLHNMLAEAARAGAPLVVASAYRSFDEQMAVKTGYKVMYGSGANAFSADQGYSEHQLGSTVDLTTPGLASLVTKFDATPAYKWLTENAYKYGFVLSYPKGNAYYQYEPWHWRFVGTALAADLHARKANFYDMNQRDINVYLVTIFD